MTRIVQIGMGTWGRDWATQVVPTVPSAQLVGCVDARPEALAATQKLGVADKEKCFTSLEAALERVEFAAVLITTDPQSHIAVVNEALAAGKHVLTEKPFALSVPEALHAVALADQRGLTLMVSQNYRFFPAVRAVQSITRARNGSASSCTSTSIFAGIRHRARTAPLATEPGTNRSLWTCRSTTSTSFER